MKSPLIKWTGSKRHLSDKIISYFYHYLLNKTNIIFNNISYTEILPKNNKDIVFIDPPYSNSDNIYYGNINKSELFDWLQELKCSWFMTFNNKDKTNNEETINVSYTSKIILESGLSSFNKIQKINRRVEENFYYNLIKE